MYNSLKITNFTCFRDISIPLNKFTIFSGINGTGKSSALRSLLLLRQSVLQKSNTVNLSGPLIDFASIINIFYEYTTTNDPISLTISCNDDLQHNFSFFYDREKELKCTEEPTCKKSGPLFNNDFVYLCAERTGLRTFSRPPANIEKTMNILGAQGEYASWLLYKNAKNKVLCDGLCHPKEESRELQKQLEAWMSELGQTMALHVSLESETDRVQLEFSFTHKNSASKKYTPENVGLGFTYSLPIFLSCLLSPQSTLVCIENPEAYLHAKAQTLVGSFLAKAAAAGQQIIIETHSEHILNGLRIAAKQKILSPDDISLNFFYRKDKNIAITNPAIDKNGRIRDWPVNFF